LSMSDEIALYYTARAAEYDVTAGYRDPVSEVQRTIIKSRFRNTLRGYDVLEIACGTGYWTEVIAAAANSVLATDINPDMLSIARQRLSRVSNVRFKVADAYSLQGVKGYFTAAFSHWWWSHMPRSQISTFLTSLHKILTPGALVLFADQLVYDWPKRRLDDEGNTLEERILEDGRRFEVVKNFPTEQEILRYLAGIAENIEYFQDLESGYWSIVYHTPEQPVR
jgi:ubiquinone/menaquinone biosynthesis C-methylase UbiE